MKHIKCPKCKTTVFIVTKFKIKGNKHRLDIACVKCGSRGKAYGNNIAVRVINNEDK